jgi:type IV pilus assembly protein PilC
MPLYTYKAKNESGKIYEGQTNVASREELTALLAEKGYSPVEIKEKNIFTDITQISFLKPRVKTKDLAIFCRQFSIVLQAGVPLAAALDVLREQTINSTFKECLDNIYDNIQKGISLTNAMKHHAKIFPEILINMVESGEVSGQLDIVFVRMADHFEKEFKLKSKIKGAMVYPIIVCVVALILVFVLLTFVLPTFTGMLKDMGTELPLITKILIGVSDFLKTFWWAVAIAVIALIIAIVSYTRSYSGKRLFSKISLKLPVIKGVIKNLMTARFTRTLSTLSASGVQLIQALEIVQRVMGNVIIAEKLNLVIEEIKKGKSMSQPLSSMKYFPPMLISMVKIGEESGELEFALEKCSDFYDDEVETSMQTLITFIEPLIIIVLAVVVGTILLSVLIPMFSLYDTMMKQ